MKLPNSRQAESEADWIGIELAARAGYAPEAAVTLWEKMIKAAGTEGEFDLLSTHPASARRMEELRALAPAMRPLYASTELRPTFAFAGSSAVVGAQDAFTDAATRDPKVHSNHFTALDAR